MKYLNDVNKDIKSEEQIEQLKEVKADYPNNKISLLEHIKIMQQSEVHRRSLIGVVGIWTYASFNYYFIGYYVKYFDGDIYVNYLMMTVADFAGPILLRTLQRYYEIC